MNSGCIVGSPVDPIAIRKGALVTVTPAIFLRYQVSDNFLQASHILGKFSPVFPADT